jgi:hypothetical protein
MGRTNMNAIILLLPLLLLVTPAIAHATNESWRYNQGFLMGVSGVELIGHHTQEFLSGYINGTHDYWYNRGYAEGNNKLPMSSGNVNYTAGYRCATDDLAQFGNLGKIPAYTNDNYGDFYLGLHQGGSVDMDSPAHDNDQWPCPTGHTEEYCAGWHFGLQRLSDELAA